MDSNDGSRVYVYRSWVRWLSWVVVLTILALGIAAFLALTGHRRGLEVVGDEVVETPVKWGRGIQFTLGDPMTMDTSKCEVGDFIVFDHDDNGRLVLTCTNRWTMR